MDKLHFLRGLKETDTHAHTQPVGRRVNAEGQENSGTKPPESYWSLLE